MPDRPELSIVDVEQAAERLAGEAVRTPVISHPAIDEAVGAQVFLKAESLQVTGAFKFRGAFNAISQLATDELAGGVVTYSSGNHAQAVALAAKRCGSTAVIVMPSDAPPEKVTATESHGARVVTYDRYTEDRAAIAANIVADEGRVVIPPYDHRDVIAGQGTAALELFDQVGQLDALFACLGGGGLLAGCCLVAAERGDTTRVYGVEPEAGNDHVLSRAAGERVDIGVPRTIADGQQVSSPGTITWPITNALATDFLTVTDAQIVSTMRLLFEATNLVVEPSGASALAALLHHELDLAGGRVGVTLSGGNIGWHRFRSLIDGTD